MHGDGRMEEWMNAFEFLDFGIANPKPLRWMDDADFGSSEGTDGWGGRILGDGLIQFQFKSPVLQVIPMILLIPFGFILFRHSFNGLTFLR